MQLTEHNPSHFCITLVQQHTRGGGAGGWWWWEINSYLSDVVVQLLFACPTLWPHGLQLTRLPCPSPSFGACSNSHPLSLWCHPTIWSSVVPFSFCLQSFPASGSFLMSWLFASGGQSIGASASAPSNEYSGLISFRTDRFDLLAVQGTGWCTIKISRTL